MGGEEVENIEKYGGGKIGHLTWLRIMREQTFNEPIFTALWVNDPAEMKALNKPPEWNAEMDIAENKEEWKKAVAFGMKWFPNKFGSVDTGRQKSMACVFKFHVKGKRVSSFPGLRWVLFC